MFEHISEILFMSNSTFRDSLVPKFKCIHLTISRFPKQNVWYLDN